MSSSCLDWCSLPNRALERGLEAAVVGGASLEYRASTLLGLKQGELVLGLMLKVSFYIQQLIEMLWIIYLIWMRMTLKPGAGWAEYSFNWLKQQSLYLLQTQESLLSGAIVVTWCCSRTRAPDSRRPGGAWVYIAWIWRLKLWSHGWSFHYIIR